MENSVMMIIETLVIGLVVWAISDVLFNVFYVSVDNAILSSGENVSGLLKAMKALAGLLVFDGVSFVVGLITAIITAFKLIDKD
jgi:uncharacterized protein with PQ loop repeat